MHLIRYISFLTIIILHSISSYARGKTWTLEECINHALEHNIRIQQQKLGIEKSENLLVQSRMEFLPDFNISFGHLMSWGRSVNLNDLEIIKNELSQSTELSLNASLEIFDGGARLFTMRKNRTDVEINKSRHEMLLQEITVEITRQYLEILLSREMMKVSEANLSSIESQIGKISRMTESGRLPASDLLDIKSQHAREYVQLTSVKNRLKSGLLKLAAYLGLKDIRGFDIAGYPENSVTEPFHEDIIISDMVNGLPQIKAAELELEKKKYDLSIARSSLYPTVALVAGYGTYYSSSGDEKFFRQFNHNRNPTLGFNVNIPVFNRYLVRTDIRNAELDCLNYELELENTRQTLSNELHYALEEAHACQEQMNAAEANLSAVEQSCRNAEISFGTGKISCTDYLTARNNLVKAQSEYIQAKYRYIFQLKIIELYKNPIPTLL